MASDPPPPEPVQPATAATAAAAVTAAMTAARVSLVAHCMDSLVAEPTRPVPPWHEPEPAAGQVTWSTMPTITDRIGPVSTPKI